MTAKASPAPTSPAVNSDNRLGDDVLEAGQPGQEPPRQGDAGGAPVARRSSSPIANTPTTSGDRERHPRATAAASTSATTATTSSGQPR